MIMPNVTVFCSVGFHLLDLQQDLENASFQRAASPSAIKHSGNVQLKSDDFFTTIQLG